MLYNALLLTFFLLARLMTLLEFLDNAPSVAQVGGGWRELAWFFRVGASESQFLDELGFRIGKNIRLLPADHRRPRVVEVDTQVCVVTFN